MFTIPLCHDVAHANGENHVRQCHCPRSRGRESEGRSGRRAYGYGLTTSDAVFLPVLNQLAVDELLAADWRDHRDCYSKPAMRRPCALFDSVRIVIWAYSAGFANQHDAIRRQPPPRRLCSQSCSGMDSHKRA